MRHTASMTMWVKTEKSELHLDKAMQIMNMEVALDVGQKLRMVKFYTGCYRDLFYA